jgi:cation diffusion facilitator family transporter
MCTSCSHTRTHQKNTQIVLLITAVAMLIEIVAGYLSNSMALLSDGWHMASHVMALGLTWFAYSFTHKYNGHPNFKSGPSKILSLSGYTSAIILLMVALYMGYESIERMIHPQQIRFSEALTVSVFGLIVNAVCAFILHHKQEHSDHNIRSAYIHVLADALTSIAGIAALLIGMYYNLVSLDAICGIVSSLVIVKWAFDLIKASAKELLDYTTNKIKYTPIKIKNQNN